MLNQFINYISIKKIKQLSFFILLSSIFFNILNYSLAKESNTNKISLYPLSDEWVGDPMPFYDKDKKEFKIFFLDDQRSLRTNGFHPWSLFTTKNFANYSYISDVIPHSNDNNSRELALGTGSVIKDKNGLYHAFYTGFNGNLDPKESIMHATSENCINWKKIPEDTFLGSTKYRRSDFRDPYVLFNEEENRYWMLITTRESSTGIIVKYTSTDLKNWKNEGVFFRNDMGTDSNLECSSLIKFKEKWYFSFSDQWPQRVTHYRIYDPNTKKFTKPSQDIWDGNGLYAGRLETDGNNLYVFGWVPTRKEYEDFNEFDWGGSLVVHQLKQNINGELYPVVNSIFDKNISNIIDPNPLFKTKATEMNENNFKFNKNNFEFVEFDGIKGTNKITGKIKINSKKKKAGFMFGVDQEHNGKVNIVFNFDKNQISVYNKSTKKINSEKAETIIPFNYKNKDSLKYTIFIEKSVLVLYINNEIAVSTRIFSMQNNNWGIFSMKNDSEFQNIKMFKLNN